MMQEYLELRNKLHGNAFHLDLNTELWRSSYLDRLGVDGGVIEVRRDGTLKGYAVCAAGEMIGGGRLLQVLEFGAENEEIMTELMVKLEARTKDESIDLISLTCFDESYDDLLTRKGFIDFASSAIMVALINPQELLAALSSKGVTGRRLNLEIAGFNPISVLVGENEIEVAEYNPEGVTLAMSDKTFVNIMFGKASLMREFLKGRIKVRGKSQLGIARRFFAIIKQENLYIPPGDGI